MSKQIIAAVTGIKKHYAERIIRKYPVGTVYGRLTVIGYEPVKDGWAVKCTCTCGGSKTVRNPNHLRRGVVSSCGCLWHETRSQLAKRLPHVQLEWGEGAFNSLFRTYEKNAFDRGLKFEITREQLKHLTAKNCSYCGASPTQVAGGSGQRYYGTYVYNGLDRVDPAKHYVLDNVVPACKTCNYVKRGMTHAEFENWIDRLVTHRSVR